MSIVLHTYYVCVYSVKLLFILIITIFFQKAVRPYETIWKKEEEK